MLNLSYLEAILNCAAVVRVLALVQYQYIDRSKLIPTISNKQRILYTRYYYYYYYYCCYSCTRQFRTWLSFDTIHPISNTDIFPCIVISKCRYPIVRYDIWEVRYFHASKFSIRYIERSISDTSIRYIESSTCTPTVKKQSTNVYSSNTCLVGQLSIGLPLERCTYGVGTRTRSLCVAAEHGMEESEQKATREKKKTDESDHKGG